MGKLMDDLLNKQLLAVQQMAQLQSMFTQPQRSDMYDALQYGLQGLSQASPAKRPYSEGMPKPRTNLQWLDGRVEEMMSVGRERR